MLRCPSRRVRRRRRGPAGPALGCGPGRCGGAAAQTAALVDTAGDRRRSAAPGWRATRCRSPSRWWARSRGPRRARSSAARSRRTIARRAADLFVDRPDGARIHVRRRGHGPVVVLLHATLSNATELDPLAIELLAGRGPSWPSTVDRPAPASMPPDDVPGPVDVAGPPRRHPRRARRAGARWTGARGRPLVRWLRRPGAGGAPSRTASHGAWLFEPPYLAVLPEYRRRRRPHWVQRIAGIARDDGLGAAALAFLETVNGPGITRRLPPACIAQFEREGRGAVADAALAGFDPTGLADIRAPVVVGLGGRSRGPYETVATGARGSASRRSTCERFPTLGHGGPISQPGVVADAILVLRRPRSATSDQPLPHLEAPHDRQPRRTGPHP